MAQTRGGVRRRRRLGARHAALFCLARTVGDATGVGVVDGWGVMPWRDGSAAKPDTLPRRRHRSGGLRAGAPARVRAPTLVSAPAHRCRRDRLVVWVRLLRAGPLLGGRGVPG